MLDEQKTILIAEDDKILNRMISFKLEKEGYKVISTTDGKAALETALAEEIDAAILDIMMPYLDGIQVLKKIRVEKPGLPVMILSAKSRQSDIHLALEMGASDYLTKPFEPETLIERLKKIMGVL
jgi:two-component system, OmpR family, alkaline phosphatase synthesis response regulator PhoP